MFFSFHKVKSINLKNRTMIQVKPNIGIVNKVTRIVTSIFIVVLYFDNRVSMSTAIILQLLVDVFILTSFLSFCPFVFLFQYFLRKTIKQKNTQVNDDIEKMD
jgi:hypothetical protein